MNYNHYNTAQLPQLDEAGLVAFLATQPDVVAAYLFGSVAKGDATPHSDIDVALLLADAHDSVALLYRQLQLMTDLEPYANRKIDVVILNNASSVLQFQVLRYGRRLYEKDRAARIEFEVRAGKIYADLKPMRDFFHQATLRELKEGRFGQRRRSSHKTDVSTKRTGISQTGTG